MRTLLESDIIEIINLYNKGKSALHICTSFKTGKKRILNILRENDVKIRDNGSVRKYTLDEKYFEKIDTPEKAQILGFLMADGCMYARERTKYLQIQLSKKDMDYLEFIKRELNTNKPLVFKASKSFISPSNNKEYIRAESLCLTICSSKIFDDCYTMGITPNKSFNIIYLPKIETQYINSFILGFFEGDGNIYHNKKHRVARFNILCQENIGEAIIDIIKEEIGIEMKKRFWMNTTANIPLYYIETQRKKELKKLFEWLYRDTSFYMGRKHDIFKEICKNE